MYLKLNKEHFTLNLQYRHCGMFANRKYEKLSYHKHDKNQKICDPILVTLLKMRPYDSQFSRENKTPIQRHIPISLL